MWSWQCPIWNIARLVNSGFKDFTYSVKFPQFYWLRWKRRREYWNAKLQGDWTEYPFGLSLPTNIHLCHKYKNYSDTNTKNIHLCHKHTNYFKTNTNVKMCQRRRLSKCIETSTLLDAHSWNSRGQISSSLFYAAWLCFVYFFLSLILPFFVLSVIILSCLYFILFSCLCVIMELILYLPGRQSCPLLQAPSFAHNNTTFVTAWLSSKFFKQ